jgi:dGTPase
MMQWTHLYSANRLSTQTTAEDNQDYARSQYQRDYDRIIFSSPFRRLQNKTQVFPLPGSIFVHNRLTHSLEVASVGRSLGNILGQRIAQAQRNPSDSFSRFYRYELGFVVATACLAHDIGNPPFGHSGEEAISSFFRKSAHEPFRQHLNEAQWTDLIHFEGNANAFRILTHQFSGRRAGGLGLTYTTLASIVKYPCESLYGFSKTQVSRKKYGFFQSEKDTYQAVAQELEISSSNEKQMAYHRHPFVFLVEAADDICYQVIDLEDAHRLGIVHTEQAKQLLLHFFDPQGDGAELQKIHTTLQQVQDHNEQIAYLRARTINKLIEQCADIFWQNQEMILAGKFERSLIDGVDGQAKGAMEELRKLSVRYIYNERSVVEIEIAGYKVLGGLLEEFVWAVLHPDSRYTKKLLELIPGQFIYHGSDTFTRIQAVVDFVSGMTDLYAVELYRKLKGITFPGLG